MVDFDHDDAIDNAVVAILGAYIIGVVSLMCDDEIHRVAADDCYSYVTVLLTVRPVRD